MGADMSPQHFNQLFGFPVPDVSLTVAEPPARRDFLLRVKLHAFPALHVKVAEKGIVPAIEWKPRHRGGHANVDADHSGLRTMLDSRAAFPERVKIEAPLPYIDLLASSMAESKSSMCMTLSTGPKISSFATVIPFWT